MNCRYYGHRFVAFVLSTGLCVAGMIAAAADRPVRPKYGSEQATGAPDTPEPGDQPTAWTSLTPDNQKEWLLLEYLEAVKASAVRVVETFNPGALERVSVFDPQGREIEVWQGEDPTPPISSMGTSSVPVKVDFPVQKVKIYLNSPAVKGSNAIDAVGLVDNNGNVRWASSATASSTYADVESVEELATVPERAVCIAHVDNTAEGKRNYADTGFGVRFTRPEEAAHVVAIQIFCSRYGNPQPPEEDFHIYLMDDNWRLIKELTCPYARIARGQERWYTFGVSPTEVPRQFGVGLWFNARQTKGIYVGVDNDVSRSSSYTGTPDSGYRPIEQKQGWMVRVCLTAAKEANSQGDKR